MSPSSDEPYEDELGFPRASGDEPCYVMLHNEFPKFSPRERG